VRLLQHRPRPVAVLSAQSWWLMSSLVLGCAGMLSGMGSVVAALQVKLFEAVACGDLVAARALNARHKVLADVFYAPPFVDMHNRMKQALTILGRIPRATVRPPLGPLGADEIRRIELALMSEEVGRLGTLVRHGVHHGADDRAAAVDHESSRYR
jgi:4-hydroxy-tetrahydrodipicolinate synthase